MSITINEGARIVINEWVHLHFWESLCIVSSKEYESEVNALAKEANKITKKVTVMMLDDLSMHVGEYFDDKEDAFDGFSAIIGATEYSLVTTKAVKRATGKGSKFLSLPLSTIDGNSMLTYDFLKMDGKQSRIMSKIIMRYLKKASHIRVTSKLGTDLKFYIKGRKPGFFNGNCKDGKGFSSSSIEVYIPIVEDRTDGLFILDGSMGYIGDVDEPIKIKMQDGKIIDIEKNKSGEKLHKYIESYEDEEMYVAAEFGIGLNRFSECAGRCYIEDESSYGTFHIGFGRNIALGGEHEARGHFDLVMKEPNIYIDNQIIMKDGKILVEEPKIYI